MNKILSIFTLILCLSACNTTTTRKNIENITQPPPDVTNTVINSVTTNSTSQIALVMGNSQYKYRQLDNTVNDATDIASMLREMDFDVTLKTDLNQVAMAKAIRDFGIRLSNRPGVGLFYFSGHGAQIDGQNYLLPIDNNKIVDKHTLKSYAIDVDIILKNMEEAKNHLNIVVLDACRDDPFRVRGFKQVRGMGRGLAHIQPVRGSIIAFATDKGKIAADISVNGRNGLYTSHLLQSLKTAHQNHQRIDDMLMQVSKAVKKESGGSQVLWYSASLEVPFCFGGCQTGMNQVKSFSSRYTDNGDGTVTDNRSGLIWLKNANCFGKQNWKTAMQSATDLASGQCGLRDGSRAGMWRLPTKNEWEAMIDNRYGSRQKPGLALSNTAGNGPWKEGNPFSGVQSNYYWSSTTDANSATNAWNVLLGSGSVYTDDKSVTFYVWPVRGWQ